MRPLALDVTDPLTGPLIRKGLPLPYPPGVFADTPSPYADQDQCFLFLSEIRRGHPPEYPGNRSPVRWDGSPAARLRPPCVRSPAACLGLHQRSRLRLRPL
jgi:hypothetical protein